MKPLYHWRIQLFPQIFADAMCPCRAPPRSPSLAWSPGLRYPRAVLGIPVFAGDPCLFVFHLFKIPRGSPWRPP
eukprot:1175666-Prorocentrum_minimum.AAC.6